MPYLSIIDDSDSSPAFVLDGVGFQDVDTGTYFVNYNSTQKRSDGTLSVGDSSATYTFTGVPATVNLWSTWYSWNSAFAQNDGQTVPYHVYDNATLLAYVEIDQHLYPIDDGNNDYQFDGDGNPLPPYDLSADGSYWRHIGTYSVSSGTLKVVIDNGLSDNTFVDAMRVSETTNSAGSCSLATTTTIDSSGTFTPKYQASAAIAASHPTMAAVGTRVAPTYAASMTKNVGHATLTATGVRAVPVFHGSCSNSVGHPTIASTAVFVPRYSGVTTLMATHATFSAAATCPIPNYHGASTLSRKPTLAVTTAHVTDHISGVATLTTSHATLEVTTTSPNEPWRILPLFLRGTEFPSWLGSVDMYMDGIGMSSASAPLSIIGRVAVEASLPLFIDSMGMLTGGLNLSVAADPRPTKSAAVTLSITGVPVGYEGMVRLTPLFMTGWDNPPYSDMNLFIEGVDRGVGGKVLNLHVRGGNPPLASSIPMYIQNNANELAYDLYMYVRGDGVIAGAMPVGSHLNLYLERGPQGGIALYVENKGARVPLPLFIAGHPSMGDQITMFIRGLGGDVMNSLPLSIPYVSSPTTSISTMPMSIPKVVGPISASTPLYVVGWQPPQGT